LTLSYNIDRLKIINIINICLKEHINLKKENVLKNMVLETECLLVMVNVLLRKEEPGGEKA